MGTWGIFLTILLTVLSPWARGQRKAQLIHREGPLQRRWVDHYQDNRDNLDVLFGHLEKSDTGKSLLAQAHKKAKHLGQPLHKLIQPGKNSLTDTTLRRRFWKSHPEKLEHYVSSRILLDRELTTSQAVLDLTHELVHFTRRKGLNPYSSPFTIRQFLTLTIEGRGGEVDASLTECKVGRELFPNLKSTQKQCEQILQEDGSYSRPRAIQLFYQVGRHYPKISQILGYWEIDPQAAFPFMSPKTPAFISSTSHSPYPLAAVKEYLAILESTCKNDYRRLDLLKKHRTRAPASWKGFGKAQKKYFKRCSHPALFQSKDILF